MIPEAILTSTSTPTHASGIKYRADIDGIRAVAVLAVVLHHFWPKWFVGGFVGVDIFFVLSGFLITSILLSQLETGTFSILEFYSRRIRRIFPALLLVLLATLCFGWMVLLHGEFKQIGKHIVAGGGFVANLVFWSETGYFDNASTTKPLLHLWSLGVEEQFYLVWPLLLWLLFSKRLNFLWPMAVIFCLSMATNVITVETNPSAAFFSPVTRFWELMAGGIAAYLQLHHREWPQKWKQVSSWSGAIALVLAFSLIKPQYLFPGWWAILPVAGTFLLIMAGPNPIVNRRFLSNKLAVWIGLISYPLYLWHWPLLSYGNIIYGEKPPYQVKIMLILAAFTLAFLTYRLIETPVRLSRKKVRVIGALSTGMVAMVVFGLLVNGGMVHERINAHGADIYLNALNDSDFPGPTFAPIHHQGIVFQKIASQTSGLTVFLGDSVMQQYGPHIEQMISSAPTKFNSIIFATAGGCPPILHTVKLPRFRYPLCPQTVDAAYDLANRPEVTNVVIGAAWYGYFTKNNSELLFEDGKLHLAFPEADAMTNSYQSLRDSIALLRKNGKNVYLVLQPPSGPNYDPRNMYAGSRFDSIHPLAKIENVALDTFLAASAPVRAQLTMIAKETGSHVIEPSNFLCLNNVCPVLDGAGEPLYTDPIHMRPKYSRSATGYLDETILYAAPAKL
ncbi:peptidoglycan/LPS O-acetylase OafA/YrhL [Oxalobacteraceae bacterium GrIS 1.11]